MSFSMETQVMNDLEQVVILVDQPILKPNPQTSLPNSHNNSLEEKRSARTLRRLNFSKPKSRFLEVYYPPHHIKTDDQPEPEPEPEHISTDEEDFDEDKIEEECDGKSNVRMKQHRRNKYIRWRSLLDWVLFLVIMTALICSLTVKSLKDKPKYGIELWKGCLMMMAIISGRFIAGSVVSVLVFILERNFVLREKVLYFVYGLRKSFQNQLWLGLVLLAWALMFRHNEAQKRNKMLECVFKALVSTLLGATIWMVKILLVKILASAFHVTTFFDRMKESVFHHYILETLSGPPLDDVIEVEVEADLSGQRNVGHSKSLPATLGKRFSMKRIGSSRKIDRDTLRKMSMESSDSAWGVKRLVNYVMSSGLSTISKTVDDFGKAESEITNEWEARTCAQRTFKNVAKPGAKCIEEEDLMLFLRREEIHTIFPFFEGALETGQIRRSSFRNWVVRAYRERKSLAHSLNDTKSAVQQLHRLASAMVVVIIVVIFLLVMGFATSKVVLLVTSQLLLVGFMFQNTCKTIFESVIFVFVMHPFDVGDRCVIDGVQMVVEEMNILTTVFLRYDNEKIFYPNSVLSTKPISNYYRSPEMGDGVDFTIDMSTSMETINALKKHIKAYIDSKPMYWHPGHAVVVTEIENVDKMKMSLGVLHTMNHQNYGEKMNRKSELVFELKRIFEKLRIKYHVLPQDVHLT